MKRKPLGYIIGSWTGDDFFVGVIESRAAELVGYYRDPGEAKRFRDTAKAQWVIDHLGRPDLYVCKLFDAGKRWWVEWPVPPGAPPSPVPSPLVHKSTGGRASLKASGQPVGPVGKR